MSPFPLFFVGDDGIYDTILRKLPMGGGLLHGTWQDIAMFRAGGFFLCAIKAIDACYI